MLTVQEQLRVVELTRTSNNQSQTGLPSPVSLQACQALVDPWWEFFPISSSAEPYFQLLNHTEHWEVSATPMLLAEAKVGVSGL